MKRIIGQLNPTTPEEYLEALFRLCEWLKEHWEEIPDGDGETDTPDDEQQTKTDMFRVIQGCADCGMDCLKVKDMVNKITIEQ